MLTKVQILATQDHVVAGVLLSKRDTFLTRGQFMQLLYAACCSSRPGADAATAVGSLEVPPPALLRPRALYTGKQVRFRTFYNASTNTSFTSPLSALKHCSECRLGRLCMYRLRVMEGNDLSDSKYAAANDDSSCIVTHSQTVPLGRKTDDTSTLKRSRFLVQTTLECL